MLLSRRWFLQGAALAPLVATLPLTAGCADEDAGPTVFVHGVASGDPTPTALIIWTRVSTAPAGAPVEVVWEVSTDDFATIAATGTVTTDATRDYTVKVDVTGLVPGGHYAYRFTALGETSAIGAARLPPDGALARLRLGVCSCASLAHGYFHAYRALAAQELDAVVHLGDYVYEYGTGEYGETRAYEPAHEILTLTDYRTRYAQYRRDPDLQVAHAAHAFIVVWDDHEVADNSWRDGANNHQPETEGAFADRKAAALQAYREWMPIRDSADGHIYRKLAFGDLVELFMLDTRLLGRDVQSDVGGPPLEDPARTLLGAAQEAWLATELPASTATWRLVGQQVMMGQLPQFVNPDAWDGYPAARTRFFDLIEQHAIPDVVVLTGDIHSSWAMDLTRDPTDAVAYNPATGRGALAVELVTPAISSPGLPESFAPTIAERLAENRHLKWVEVSRRGFIVLDVDRERVHATFRHLDDAHLIVPEPTDLAVAAEVEVRRGTPRLIKL